VCALCDRECTVVEDFGTATISVCVLGGSSADNDKSHSHRNSQCIQHMYTTE